MQKGDCYVRDYSYKKERRFFMKKKNHLKIAAFNQNHACFAYLNELEEREVIQDYEIYLYVGDKKMFFTKENPAPFEIQFIEVRRGKWNVFCDLGLLNERVTSEKNDEGLVMDEKKEQPVVSGILIFSMNQEKEMMHNGIVVYNKPNEKTQSFFWNAHSIESELISGAIRLLLRMLNPSFADVLGNASKIESRNECEIDFEEPRN